MTYLSKAAYAVSKGICWVSALGLAAMMLLTCADVIFRYFGYPIKGTYDIVGICGAFVIALSIAYTQMLRGHVGIDFIVMTLPGSIQKTIDTTNYLLNIFIYALLAWQCGVYGKKLWTVGRVSETIQVPLFPFPFIVGIGCGLMCLILILELFNLISNVETR
jgi:TRAP-type C4-dicarboxylate transport system permease small subunit